MKHGRFKVRASDGHDMMLELRDFANFIGLEKSAPERYSLLLLLELYGGMKSGQIDPAKIIHEIQGLEGLRKQSHLKPPSLFGHAPLKGLWHKHYLVDGLPSMAKNLQRAMHKYGLPWLENALAEVQASGEERVLTEQDIFQITHDVTFGHLERLSGNSELTGEWIIFAHHQNKNYYLCLGKHKSGDHLLRSKIDEICVHEFPFLADILPPLNESNAKPAP